MKTVFMQKTICQSRGCERHATWREVDRYTQQKQTYTYFYYFCDEHKEKAEQNDTVGHNKTFDRVNS